MDTDTFTVADAPTDTVDADETVEEHFEDLTLTADVPFETGSQVQGDVFVRDITDRPQPTIAAEPISVPSTGVAVVRGENGGNTHLLVADPNVTWTANPRASVTDLVLGVVTVPDGSTALLDHPEHKNIGLAPGVYEIRRQREMAEEMRLVAD